MKKRKAFPVNLFLLLLCALFLGSCSDGSSEPDGSKPDNDTPKNSETIGPVVADGVLEAVTWNLEWYGVPENGPHDENLQTKNFLTILDTLSADLYAFQEVSNNTDLNRLVSHMKGYKGFVAPNMVRDQKTAFVYNTEVIDSVSSGLITEGQDAYDWASGRFPFYFKFNYTAENESHTIYAVVIHAKCCTDASSYDRRKQAAQSLYTFLINNNPNAQLLILGDFNDDMDVSIYHGKPSPYLSFLNDTQNFKVVTKIISDKHQSTTVNYDDAVDHMVISDELFDEYIPQSAKVLTVAADLIKNYGTTTSDHYPVWARFDL